MKVHFSLHYKTQPGETLHALIYREGATVNENKINIPLTACDNDFWKGEIQLLLKQPLRLNYHYEVRRGPHIERREWQLIPRILELKPTVKNYFLHDNWRDFPRESCLDAAAMTAVLRRRITPGSATLSLFKRTLVLQAHSARPNAQEQLWLTGNGEILGNWDPAQAKPMQEIAPNEWAISLDATTLSFPFEYKFLVRAAQGEKVCWEGDKNRICKEGPLADEDVCTYADLRPVFDCDN